MWKNPKAINLAHSSAQKSETLERLRSHEHTHTYVHADVSPTRPGKYSISYECVHTNVRTRTIECNIVQGTNYGRETAWGRDPDAQLGTTENSSRLRSDILNARAVKKKRKKMINKSRATRATFTRERTCVCACVARAREFV